MANPVGRPCEYDPEYVDKVDEYLATRQDSQEDYTTFSGDKGIGTQRIVKVKLPTVEGFAMFLGISKQSLYSWEQDYPLFMDALNKIRLEQKERLLDKGLSGDYNSTIAKLVLSHNHGFREKTDITSDGQPIVFNTVSYKDGEEKENTNG